VNVALADGAGRKALATTSEGERDGSRATPSIRKRARVARPWRARRPRSEQRRRRKNSHTLLRGARIECSEIGTLARVAATRSAWALPPHGELLTPAIP